MKTIVRYAPEKNPCAMKPKPFREYAYEAEATDVLDALNEIYRQFNVVDGEEYISLNLPQEHNIHIGDAVNIFGDWYIIAASGFIKTNLDGVKAVQALPYEKMTVSANWEKMEGMRKFNGNN